MVALTDPPFSKQTLAGERMIRTTQPGFKKKGRRGSGDHTHVGSFDFAEEGRETILIMLVKTTNQPNRKTAARESFCVNLSCNLQIAGIGMTMMMRSQMLLNAAYAYHDAPRSKQVPGCRLSQSLCIGLHSNTEAMPNANDPTSTTPARTWANRF